MSAEERRLVLLDNRYPDVSRMTRFRISQEADFPDPIIVRGRKYYDDAELTAWEETRRCRRQQSSEGTSVAETEAEVEPLVSDRTISVVKSEKHSKAKPHRTLAAGIPAAKADA